TRCAVDSVVVEQLANIGFGIVHVPIGSVAVEDVVVTGDELPRSWIRVATGAIKGNDRAAIHARRHRPGSDIVEIVVCNGHTGTPLFAPDAGAVRAICDRVIEILIPGTTDLSHGADVLGVTGVTPGRNVAVVYVVIFDDRTHCSRKENPCK